MKKKELWQDLALDAFKRRCKERVANIARCIAVDVHPFSFVLTLKSTVLLLCITNDINRTMQHLFSFCNIKHRNDSEWYWYVPSWLFGCVPALFPDLPP